MKLGRIKFKVKDLKLGDNVNQSPTKSYYEYDDYEMGRDDISDEFIEIDCAVVDQIKCENVCKVCWSSE